MCRVPRLNLGNLVDKDDNEVDYTLAMDSPLVAAAAGFGYAVLIICWVFLIFSCFTVYFFL